MGRRRDQGKRPSRVFPTESVLRGNFEKGKPDGFGKIQPLPMGGTYEGEWEPRDHRSGHRRKCQWRAITEGSFRNAQHHAKALCQFPAAMSIQGDWWNGVSRGGGKITGTPMARFMIVEIVDGDRDGTGTVTMARRVPYTGQGKYGQIDGHGTLGPAQWRHLTKAIWSPASAKAPQSDLRHGRHVYEAALREDRARDKAHSTGHRWLWSTTGSWVAGKIGRDGPR